MGRISALGCVVCQGLGYGPTPAEVHHIGDTSERSDLLVIPLCPAHHRSGGSGVAYHAGPKRWEALYGTELSLLAKTLELLERQR